MAAENNNVTFNLTTENHDRSISDTVLLELPWPDICVICLDRVSQRITALPCKHDQFDLPCLGTWLQNHRSCPLCKADVHSIKIQNAKKDGYDIIQLAPEDSQPKLVRNVERLPSSAANGRRRQQRRNCQQLRKDNDPALQRRREIYQEQLFSLHVGTNRISGYRNLSPELFRRDPTMISKARRWIRRELAVFEFLDPCSESFGRIDRRASNAEYLLEYIIAILKVIDIKGSAGQATELLKDFLGRENAGLFMHELESWLRSPFDRLNDWDRAVQYRH